MSYLMLKVLSFELSLQKYYVTHGSLTMMTLTMLDDFLKALARSSMYRNMNLLEWHYLITKNNCPIRDSQKQRNTKIKHTTYHKQKI